MLSYHKLKEDFHTPTVPIEASMASLAMDTHPDGMSAHEMPCQGYIRA